MIYNKFRFKSKKEALHAFFSNDQILFHHIPKTAGESLSAFICDNFGYNWQRFLLSIEDITTNHQASHGAMLWDKIKIYENWKDRQQFLFGHFSFDQFNYVNQELGNVNNKIIILRHPIDIIISLYRFDKFTIKITSDEFVDYLNMRCKDEFYCCRYHLSNTSKVNMEQLIDQIMITYDLILFQPHMIDFVNECEIAFDRPMEKNNRNTTPFVQAPYDTKDYYLDIIKDNNLLNRFDFETEFYQKMINIYQKDFK
jgi:hypothetical protein